MATTTTEKRTYEEAVNWLRDHGFDILEAPGTKNRVFLKKNSVSAAIERGDDGRARLFAKPGVQIGGETLHELVIFDDKEALDRFKSGKISFQNVLATIYHVLGIDPSVQLTDFTGRPQFLLDDREPIAELV